MLLMGILHGAFYAFITYTSIHLYIIYLYVHTLIHLYVIRSYINIFLYPYTYILTVTNTNYTDINLHIDINLFALTIDYLIDH